MLRHKIRCQRRTLAQIHRECVLESDNKLYLGKDAIAVVYFRAGYTPNDYPSQSEWDARLLLERSNAIKCPSVALQLAGAKKVQQALAEPGCLERFLPREFADEASALRDTFMGMWPMDDTELGKVGQRLAQTEPHRFVLKPQREGGGNNIYRGNISPALQAMAVRDRAKARGDPRECESYILMELIRPPANLRNRMVRGGTGVAAQAEIVSELGCFGVALFRCRKMSAGAEMIQNSGDGHLLRTKGSTDDEGGVAVGFSVIDSPLLVGI